MRALIFDLDGTLVDAAGAFRVYRDAAELHESLDELGIALPPS